MGLDLRQDLRHAVDIWLAADEPDIRKCLRLRDQIPPEVVLVSESGIRTREDVLRLERAGVQAILVGETLMKSADLGKAVEELLGLEERE